MKTKIKQYYVYPSYRTIRREYWYCEDNKWFHVGNYIDITSKKYRNITHTWHPTNHSRTYRSDKNWNKPYPDDKLHPITEGEVMLLAL